MSTGARNVVTPGDKIWRSAVCPRTGRTYYYDAITRETQWAKPPELASPSEKQQMLEKQRKQKEFFQSMENNILKSLQQGCLPGNSSNVGHDEDDFDTGERQPLDLNSLTLSVPRMQSNHEEHLRIPKKSKVVRTISQMDENVLVQLSGDDTKEVDFDMYIPRSDSSVSRRESGSMADVLKALNSVNIEPIEDDDLVLPSRVPLTRRNTGSTLYVRTTMSDPDKDATIKCVCGVYRAHILQSMKDSKSGISPIPFEEYDVFNDIELKSIKFADEFYFENENLAGLIIDDDEIDVPSLEEITRFYRDIFQKSQMESDCIIMSLIYVEKLMKETNGGVRPRAENWRSVLFASMIMSSKVWDDLSMWNSDFSKICRSFTLKRVNELEVAMLSVLKYNVKVPASEYAKYYFLLRSMIIRSGLGSDEVKNLAPLDIEEAKRLQFFTSNFEKSIQSDFSKEGCPPKLSCKRSKSLNEADRFVDPFEESSPSHSKTQSKATVSLEQVVRMGT